MTDLASLHGNPDKSDEVQIAEILNRIAAKVQLPPTIVDVGANLNASVSAPFIAQGWSALLIEPQSYCAGILREKFGKNKNVVVVQCACSDSTGTAPLMHGKEGLGSELATLNQDVDAWTSFAVSRSESEEVRVRLLKDVLAEHGGFAEVGILKVDTESWDYAVLRGAGLDVLKPKIIVTEEYLWKSADTVSKHILLEDAGYINLGFVRYNTVWIHHSLGLRWSHDVLGPWLSDLGFPTPFQDARSGTHGIGELIAKTRVDENLSYASASIWIACFPTSTLKTGQDSQVLVTITNMSNLPIPSLATSDGNKGIYLSYHVLDAASGAVLNWDGPRLELPRDIRPGVASPMLFSLHVPAHDAPLRLVFELVQERVGWFGSGGAAGANSFLVPCL